MAENFLKWKKETDIQIQEAQGLQTNETKETHDKAYITKTTKFKDKRTNSDICKRNAMNIYKGTIARLSAGFSAEILRSQKEVA